MSHIAYSINPAHTSLSTSQYAVAVTNIWLVTYTSFNASITNYVFKLKAVFLAIVYDNCGRQHHLSYNHTGDHWGSFVPSNIPIRFNLKVLYYHRRDEYNGNELVTDSTYEAIQVARRLQLDNITQLLRVVAVLPVTSNEAERSFSRLKLIKTYLRNLMTNER